MPPVYENLFGTPQHLWRPISRSVWPDSNRCVSVPFVSCSCTSPHFSNAKIHSSLCLQDNNADRTFDGAFLSGYSVSVRCNFAIAQKTVLPDPPYRCGPDFDNYSPRQVPPDYQIAMTQRIYAAQATVIRNLNDKGPCVIVGRCADAILPDAVNIFVFSDMENRINRIMSLNPGLTREEAKASILAVDKRRKAYHEYYSTTQWGDMDAYDICLNSGLAGVEGCLEAALTYIKYVK